MIVIINKIIREANSFETIVDAIEFLGVSRKTLAARLDAGWWEDSELIIIKSTHHKSVGKVNNNAEWRANQKSRNR